MAIREYTQEETLEAIRQKAAQEDKFTIRIHRFANPVPGVQGILVATLSEATVAHVMRPETWLPMLCGGGTYAMEIFHPSTDPHQAVGRHLRHIVEGESRIPAHATLAKPNWSGPKVMDFPQAPAAVAEQHVGVISNSGGTAPQNSVLSGSGVTPTSDPALFARMNEMSMALNSLQQRERQLEDQKRAWDFDRLRQDNELKLKELAAQIQRPQAQPVEHNWMKDIATVLASVIPIFLSSQQQTRELMMKQDAERLKQEAERAQQNNLMLMKMMERPPVDPLMEKMLDRISSVMQQSTPQAEMIGQMAELTMSMVDRAAEMANGPTENPWIQAAKEFAKGLSALTPAIRTKRPAGPPPPPRYVPTPVPMPANGQARPGFAGYPGPGAGAVPTQNFQAPTVDASAAAIPTVEIPAGVDPRSVLGQLIYAIKTYAPQQLVIAALIKNLDDVGFQKELAAVEGSPQALVVRYLGDWIPTDPRNQPYLTLLLEELNKQGSEAGIMEPEEDEAAEAEAPEEEGGESEA